MVDLTRRALVLALVALAACSDPAPTTPAEVVDAYFRHVGRDPIRTLPLLSPAFHAQHGLHVVTTAEARARQRRVLLPDVPASPDAAAARVPLAPDRLQLGWLALQRRPTFAARFESLRVEPIGEEVGAGVARVAVRVVPRGAPAFEQIFALSRGDDRAWRIDGVAQRGLVDANRLDAYVAHPTEAARRALERRPAP